jgi:NAD(P)-dependent dehydrogenase (short-subunit alcohol dehydrogenase family)
MTPLAGRNAVVTGASSGIGKEIARGLAQRGAHVILACRDRGRAEAARDDIASSTGRRDLEILLVDFSLQSSIRGFASRLLDSDRLIHVLVNNAGCWSSSHRPTPEGIETTWATNMLGYFLTTQLLLPRLAAASPSRIVSVASTMAYGLDLADIGFERRGYDGMAAYAQSKQANRMWTWALARRLAGTGVTANAIHPGGVRTGIFAKGGGLRGAAAGLFARFAGRSPGEGADTAVWLATDPALSETTGRFFVDRKEQACEFRDPEQEERLWALCATMTG